MQVWKIAINVVYKPEFVQAKGEQTVYRYYPHARGSMLLHAAGEWETREKAIAACILHKRGILLEVKHPESLEDNCMLGDEFYLIDPNGETNKLMLNNASEDKILQIAAGQVLGTEKPYPTFEQFIVEEAEREKLIPKGSAKKLPTLVEWIEGK